MSHVTHSISDADMCCDIPIKHVPDTNESWHMYEWVTSHIGISHVTCAVTYPWNMSQIHMSHGTCMNESRLWHTYKWVVWRVSFIHRLIYTQSWRTFNWVYMSLMYECVPSVIAHIWMSLMYERVSSRTPLCTLTFSMTYSWVTSHLLHMHEAYHRYRCVMVHIEMSHGTHMNEARHICWIFIRHVTNVDAS